MGVNYDMLLSSNKSFDKKQLIAIHCWGAMFLESHDKTWLIHNRGRPKFAKNDPYRIALKRKNANDIYPIIIKTLIPYDIEDLKESY